MTVVARAHRGETCCTGPVPNKLRMEVANVVRAARVFRAWININGYGASHCAHAEIINADGETFATVSYNGRVRTLLGIEIS